MSVFSYSSAELAALAGARNYYRWILSRFAPYLGRRMVEVGAGVGTLARLLLDEVEPVRLVLVEPAENLAALLRARFAADACVEVVHGYLDALPAALEVDGVVLVNVLEHVEHERPFLEAAARVLAPGGCLLLFVPAGPWLFGTLDAEFGHHRRYTKPALERVLHGAGLRLRFMRYVNAPGVVGWFVAGRILRTRTLAPHAVALYDRWVIPWLSRVEAAWSPPFGQSLVAVAAREGDRALGWL